MTAQGGAATSVEIPDGAGEAIEIEWFRDLVVGAGHARSIDLDLRRALVLGTVDVASEEARSTADERRARWEAEKAARDKKAAEAAAATRAALRAHITKVNRSVRGLAVTAAILCATVVGPWYLGGETRDGPLRPRGDGVMFTSQRDTRDYFLTDWLAGCAWVAGAFAVLIAIVAAVGILRKGANTALLLVPASLGVAALVAGYSAVDQWATNESRLAAMFEGGVIPPGYMNCPGVMAGPYLRGEPTQTFFRQGATWTVALRQLSDVEGAANREFGACVYRGWNYVATVDLGEVSPLPVIDGVAVEEEWRLEVGAYGDPPMLFFLGGFAGDDALRILGFPFSALPEPKVGPLRSDLGGRDTAGWPDGPNFVGAAASWQLSIDGRTATDARPGVGSYLVLGPVTDPGAVRALEVVNARGERISVSPSVSADSFLIRLDGIYFLEGATQNSGSAVAKFGVDSILAWVKPCPAGGPVSLDTALGEFACANATEDGSPDFVLDFDSQDWVARN